MVSRGSRRSWRIVKPFLRIANSAAGAHELARAINAAATLNLKPSLMSESHSLLPRNLHSGRNPDSQDATNKTNYPCATANKARNDRYTRGLKCATRQANQSSPLFGVAGSGRRAARCV